MILVVKVRFKIVLEWTTGMKKSDVKTYDLQKVEPCKFAFKLSEVRAFSDSDVKYILKNMPNYKLFKEKVKTKKADLDMKRGELIEFLKKKDPIKFEKCTLQGSTISLDMKLSHGIYFEENLTKPYVEYVPGTYVADDNMGDM